MAGLLVSRELRPARRGSIDTRLRSGRHVVFVFIAPTSPEHDTYQEHIREAKAAVREQAVKAGYYFSTIGISDDWSISRGLSILEPFGPFDEVTVGRNWFNTGIKRFVNDLAGEAVVPQIAVVLEEVAIDTIPFRYGAPVEIVRVVGRQAMETWAGAGFKVSLPQ